MHGMSINVYFMILDMYAYAYRNWCSLIGCFIRLVQESCWVIVECRKVRRSDTVGHLVRVSAIELFGSYDQEGLMKICVH